MSIVLENLVKIYAESRVLDLPELRIGRGELIGLVGNNGAGKTTLLRLMLDLVKADRGTVQLFGKQVAQSEHWKPFTSAYLDAGFLIDFLSPAEYFEFIGQCYAINKQAYAKQLDELLPLMHDELLGKTKYIHDFSSGNKQKIGLIAALIPNAQILLLDEPFNFLDPSAQYFLQDYIQNLNKTRNTTIILSSHHIDQVAKIATRILVLEKGKLIQDIREVNQEAKEQLQSYFQQQK